MPPASVTRIDSTDAKIGRSTKNRVNTMNPREFPVEQRSFFLAPCRGLEQKSRWRFMARLADQRHRHPDDAEEHIAQQLSHELHTARCKKLRVAEAGDQI